MKKVLTLIVLGLLLLSFGPFESPFGMTDPEPIGPYLNGVFPEKNPLAGDWVTVNAYPNLTFVDPIAMAEIRPQGDFFVAGKQGYLWQIAADSTTSEKKVVLDITDLVITGEDAGLINFVLHPEFALDNSEHKGFVYIMYAHHPTIEHGNEPRLNRLSRFTYDFDLEKFDRDSEFILIQDYDPQGYHQGGGMFFDNQGFLNFTVGDGGSTPDGLFFDAAQQIDKYLWGGLFRIDVDKNPNTSHPIRRTAQTYPGAPQDFPGAFTFTTGYYIPNDNPWQDENGGILEEFFALGLRSPHRATYDPVEEQVWVGDVGNGLREEITILPKGGNAQWPYREGIRNGLISKPDNIIGVEAPPKFDYSRSDGVAVIGGFVYRGEKWAQILDGFYLFADHSNGNIWSLNPVTEEVSLVANIPRNGVGGKNGIGSFATDAAGEVYLLNLFGLNRDGGTINKLVLKQSDPEYIPQTLSEIGAFSDLNSLQTIDGLIPYQTNAPLWSDGASKDRWVSIPNDGSHDTPEEQVIFSENEHWKFPPGTVFIKHFELPLDENNPSITKRLETRFFIVDKFSVAYGLSYKWNDEGTEAALIKTELAESYPVQKANGSTEMQTWNYPNSLQCNSCHTANAGFVLGAKTAQLNGLYTYSNGSTANQLATWEKLGIFANSITSLSLDDLPKAVSISDDSASDELRVMSYLDANCAHCHRPNGVDGVFDARFSTPLFYKSLIQEFGVSHNTPFGEKMIVPKDHATSQVWIRDNSLEQNKMPPISKNKIDEEYIEVLTRWIDELEENEIGPCELTYLSTLEWEPVWTNDWGPIERDRNNGGEEAEDGTAISIGGQSFSRGLGTHANSEVSFKINCAYESFSVSMGIDDATCNEGSAIFEIWGDGKLLFASDILYKGDPAKYISLDITGVNLLTLKTLQTEDGGTCDHTNWGDALLQRCAQTGLTTIAKAFAFGADDYTTSSANAPEINYTKVIRKDEEFLYAADKGYGYTDISGLDTTPNKRDELAEELYNQFIGAKGGSITFRVDIPNGDYRLLLVGGDPNSNGKQHSIKVRDGSSGFFTTLVDNVTLDGPNFYKVGFNDTKIPDQENVQIESSIVAPKISVTKGYIEILQTAEQGSGGDICLLEIWPDAPKKDPTPRGIGLEIDIEAMPNPFSTELGFILHRPDEFLTHAEVFIYDLNGRLLYQDMQVPFGMKKTIPIHQGWSSGTYLLKARAGDYRGTHKLIRQ